MYKLLFAEDETATREGILACIDWKSLGIGEVKAYKNGMLAYEAAKEWTPDILLTDIRMPRMDGIELCHKIRELNPSCSILMISGYSEVDYLKSAIKLKAVDFVDKPLQLDVLTEQLKNAVAEQENHNSSRNLEIQKISYDFIRGNEAPEELASMLANIGIAVSVSDLCLSICIEIRDGDERVSPDDFSKSALNILSSKNITSTWHISADRLLYLQIITGKENNVELGPEKIYNLLSEENNNINFCCSELAPISDYKEAVEQMKSAFQSSLLHPESGFHAFSSAKKLPVSDEVIAIIEKDYTDKNLSLDEITRRLHRSPSYICINFKKDTGKTLTSYLNEFRIKASCELLKSTDDKINTIAEAVGYDNGNYYAKIFKKIMNMSPVEYREKSLHL